MPAQKNQYIASAYEQLQIVSQDREKRLEYEARQKAIWDYNQMMKEAEERGRQKAILDHSQMMKEATERGRKEGEKRINKLHALLIEEKRYADLECSVNDEDFRQQLMKQHGI